MALTDTHIRTIKSRPQPFKVTDGGGLHLEVRPTGSKLWRYRFRLHGKENVYAIGEYPAISLAEARKARDDAKNLVREGLNPAQNRKLDRLKATLASRETFRAVAEEWVESRAVESKWSDSYRHGVKRILEGDLFPAFGNLPIRQIKAAHLLAALKSIEKRGALTVAARARYLSSEIWRYAVGTLRADSDLAASLRGAVRMPSHEHHPSLKRDEIPAFLAALGNYSGRKETATALKLLLLLFPRPGELLGASWAEFDLDAELWRIPAQRMKMGEPHVVPLSQQALEQLRELHSITGGNRLLFPNLRRPRTCMTGTTMNRALERMGYGGHFSAHGFRATASTLLNEMGCRPDVIERQLAHAERSKTRAAYNQASFLAERTAMMQQWADYVGALASGKVASIGRTKAA